MNKSSKMNTLDSYGDVLTVRELAAVLRIGKNAAYDLVRAGTVTSIRVGHKYLVPKNRIFDFLKTMNYTDRVD
jgi:excisionase family DNA binding protein